MGGNGFDPYVPGRLSLRDARHRNLYRGPDFVVSMRGWSFLLTFAFLLSGCFGGDGDGGSTPSPSPSESPSPEPSTSAEPSPTPTTSAPSPNRAPTASLSASTEGGALPLLVNFTLDGSDPDGDDLTWSFDADGDGAAEETGEALPADVSFNYTAAGIYNATLNVTDGEAFDEAVVVLNVTAATAAGQMVSLSWAVGNGGCGSSYDSWAFGTPMAGVLVGEAAVDPLTIGKPYTAEFTFEDPTGAAGFVGLDFYDSETPPAPPEKSLVEGGSFVFAPGPYVVSGTVPEGALYLLAYDCFGVPGGSVTYTAG